MPGQAKCAHCATTFQTNRPDLRKWCDLCRTLKSIIVLRKKTHRCAECKEAYYAWDNDSARSKIKLCAECVMVGAFDTATDRDCALCHRATGLIPRLRLCWVCATQAENEKAAIRAFTSITKKWKEQAHA